MKIGYPCVNLSLPCSSSHRFRLSSYSAGRIEETVRENLSCLMQILRFNVENGILFFRISSDLVPFASHPVCDFPWQKVFRRDLREIGDLIREHTMRVGMHPDQFILINSVNRDIYERSVKELLYHAEVLDLLGVDLSSKIQIHVGGAYGDRKKAILRFIERYAELPDTIRRRLVIENDERIFTVDDCLSIHRETGIPVVFDTLHFACNNNGEGLRKAFGRAHATWSGRHGLPVVDYSSQDPKKKKGSHAAAIDPADFARFIERTRGFDFDIMCEIKNKEKSVIRAAQVLIKKGLMKKA